MGYCEGDCKHLNESTHKCVKYGKKLAYMKQSGRGSFGFCVHKQYQLCVMDEYIETITKELENKTKECDFWHRQALTATSRLGMLRMWFYKRKIGERDIDYILEDCKTMFTK